MIDAVIIGAGFAGSVVARKLAEEKGKRVLLIEKRRHIAGNCYDYRDRSGILVHQYGPHLFHTSNKNVYSFLEQFSPWREYQHRVLGSIDGKEVPLPFNLQALEMLFPPDMAVRLGKKLIDTFGFGVKIPILSLNKSEDPDLKMLADFVYEKVFLHYTAKQWDLKPEEISKEVTARVPVHISYDCRYFQDSYQAVPLYGYTHLFENLVDHPFIHLLLQTEAEDLLCFDWDKGNVELMGQKFTGEIIYTGMIDELFHFRFGALPYRSIDFKFQEVPQKFFQDVATVNYPNNYDFTRITEFKHIHPVHSENTVILKEYPRMYQKGVATSESPCYPVFNDANMACFQQYQEFSKKFENIVLLGRLAEYRYYDMDDIVERALQVYQERLA